MADVPLAPSNAGVVGGASRSDESTANADREATAERESAERREVF
jgi:hypothetical protein